MIRDRIRRSMRIAGSAGAAILCVALLTARSEASPEPPTILRYGDAATGAFIIVDITENGLNRGAFAFSVPEVGLFWPSAPATVTEDVGGTISIAFVGSGWHDAAAEIRAPLADYSLSGQKLAVQTDLQGTISADLLSASFSLTHGGQVVNLTSGPPAVSPNGAFDLIVDDVAASDLTGIHAQATSHLREKVSEQEFSQGVTDGLSVFGQIVAAELLAPPEVVTGDSGWYLASAPVAISFELDGRVATYASHLVTLFENGTWRFYSLDEIEPDTTPPTSGVGQLAGMHESSPIDVAFEANDDGVGVDEVELWWRHRASDAVPWGEWALGVTDTTSPMSFELTAGGGFYEFYSIAIDNAGNREAPPLVADASTEYLPAPDSHASDTFTRSLADTWGDAEVGGSYTLQGSAANYDVVDGLGTMVVPSAGTNRSALLDEVSALDVDVSFRVKTDDTATGGSPAYVYAVSRRDGSNAYRPKLIFNTNHTVALHASRLVNGAETALAPPVVVPGLTHVADEFIWVRAQVSGTDPTTVRVKAWADGSNEPALWLFEATDSTAALQAPGSVGLHAYLGSASYSFPLLFTFDDYAVLAPD